LSEAAADRTFLQGAHALAEAAVRAGCRFYCGYPMTPSTEILEYMARRLPEVDGVFLNAESEIEAIHMVWGAAGAGTRAMTASTTNGIALMQEALAEMALARIPAVVVNMGRGQGDYFQSTRGGGHGSHPPIVLSPSSAQEAVDAGYRAFAMADRWRHPVLVLGDFLLSHTAEAVSLAPPPEAGEPRPPLDWITDGARGRPPRLLTPLGMRSSAAPDPERGPAVDTARPMIEAVERMERIAAREVRFEAEGLEDAALVVAAFGTLGRFARHAARKARREGLRIGLLRPYTLVPFPSAAFRHVAERGIPIAVWENNAGQMVDDVRLAVAGRAPVHFVGGISMDPAGFGIGPAVDADDLLRRLRDVYPREGAGR